MKLLFKKNSKTRTNSLLSRANLSVDVEAKYRKIALMIVLEVIHLCPKILLFI